jgi:hypothetical protein
MAERRHPAGPRTTFAAGQEAAGVSGPARHPVARAAVASARLVLGIGAAVAAAVAGLVFLVLLPICGIASLAEGFGKACWQTARTSLPLRRRGAMSH